MSAGGEVMQGLCGTAKGKTRISAVSPCDIGTVQDDREQTSRGRWASADEMESLRDWGLCVGGGLCGRRGYSGGERRLSDKL